QIKSFSDNFKIFRNKKLKKSSITPNLPTESVLQSKYSKSNAGNESGMKSPAAKGIKTEAARRNPADGQKTKPATDY
uniref:hypothetical protein n=1 Tax=Alistipes putredinis TaxID=28117 RepID=UPI003FD6CCE2